MSSQIKIEIPAIDLTQWQDDYQLMLEDGKSSSDGSILSSILISSEIVTFAVTSHAAFTSADGTPSLDGTIGINQAFVRSG